MILTFSSVKQESLAKVHKYFLRYGLLLNESKTQCVFIGNKQLLSRIPDDIVINFNDTSISPTHTVENLGLYMDSYMLFDNHVNEITKKAIGILAYISRVKACSIYHGADPDRDLPVLFTMI